MRDKEREREGEREIKRKTSCSSQTFNLLPNIECFRATEVVARRGRRWYR